MLNCNSAKDIDKIEKELKYAIKHNDWCCADQGICHHDKACIKEMRRTLKANGGKSNEEIRAMGRIPIDDLWRVWPDKKGKINKLWWEITI